MITSLHTSYNNDIINYNGLHIIASQGLLSQHTNPTTATQGDIAEIHVQHMPKDTVTWMLWHTSAIHVSKLHTRAKEMRIQPLPHRVM